MNIKLQVHVSISLFPPVFDLSIIWQNRKEKSYIKQLAWFYYQVLTLLSGIYVSINLNTFRRKKPN